jgi:neurotransmitter:Na+ symporter, NSS family
MEETCKLITQDRDQWTSEGAFVFSMTAAAVGLGNLWRFPYMVGENGGGAFIIAYLLCLVVVVVPIMMLEVGAGRLASGNTVHTFRQVNRFGTFYGWFVVLLTTVITSYYLVITGWTLGYAVAAWLGDIPDFKDFSAGYNSLWYFLVVTVLAAGLLMYGVKAIEKLSKILMPALLLLIIVLVITAAGTAGWTEAKAFMFEADFSLLRESRLWIFALGQAFYTLAIGQGYLVTYGSYIPRKTNVPRACLIVAGTETSVALLAGFMIFPFVFTFGMQPDEGSQLAFSTLPAVFNSLAKGSLLGILFFTLFFTAAFSSCLAGLKVIISAVAEELKLKDNHAVGVVAAVIVLLGIPSALSFSPLEVTLAGMPFLDFMDQFGGTNVVIFSGILGATLFCWFVPADRVRVALGAHSNWWIWRIYIVGRALPVLVLMWLGWLAITT